MNVGLVTKYLIYVTISTDVLVKPNSVVHDLWIR